ncbi:MAG: lipoate--protein ligase family protein [Halobacteria archaeon]
MTLRKLENPGTEAEDVSSLLLRKAEDTGSPIYVVDSPDPTVSFGRRDGEKDGFGEARRVAEKRGYNVKVRRTGGGAVIHDGNTLGFAAAFPVRRSKTGIQERYEAVIESLARELRLLDPGVEEREPEGSFCPGQHSLSNETGKVVGISQKVRKDAAVVAGIINLELCDHVPILYFEVYDALGCSLDPDTVGRLSTSSSSVEEAVEVSLKDAWTRLREEQ